MPEKIAVSPKLHVSLAIYQHVLATSLTLPVEMLLAGEAYAKRYNKSIDKLQTQFISDSDAVISSRAGMSLVADIVLADIEHSEQVPDFIIVPSLWRNPRPVLRKQTRLIKWLNHCWQHGSTLIGVGTGVCFLAESGLLDDHPATTHWHYGEQFKRDYPAVDLKPDFFITQSERIYCAASLNALADIIVHIIEQTYGRAAAQNVERNFSHEIRKPYEEQRYLEGAVDRHADELVAQIQFWLRTNLHSELSLSEVAEQFGLSQRSFTRRFKAAVGVRATQYWQQLRIEAAKDLLASSNLTIQEVAVHVGYQDQGHLTKLFKTHLGLTPKKYRAMVRRKLFSQE
ncbi:GlxA family transcriptional regulator [Litorilituus lipolyticus]|uniref:Helix-turn-helix domain-containing protein n=1 Tax=Litorilituus lipolyticus TaxID=2491017 RepID=A0A502L5L3_9GAMM|nr:helix-turn-helix domain-containing protein [Litorilituus lipolyticus]TPH17343.1 helix-turn-helix domain-containing protein [Litorilituus lipolyticus]